MTDQIVYITEWNKSRVLEAEWLHGAFHLTATCRALHRLCNGHCPSPAIPVTVRYESAHVAWKSYVFVQGKPVGHLCALCFKNQERVQSRDNMAPAFEVF